MKTTIPIERATDEILVEIKVTGLRRFNLRCKLGVWLLKLGAWVLPLKTKVIWTEERP